MHYYKKLFIFILLILIFTGCSQSNEKNSKTIISTKDSMPILELTTPSNLNSKETTEELKVAFIADQVINENAKKVLQLIKNEKTDMVIHTGDFGCCNSIIKYLYVRESYIGTALDWDAQITNILGPNFPYFGTIGNHMEVTGPPIKNYYNKELIIILILLVLAILVLNHPVIIKGYFFYYLEQEK